MNDIIQVNTAEAAAVNVYWQDAVDIELDLQLMYIKSGEKEIDKYVENSVKPEIDKYLEVQSEPIVAAVVQQLAEPVVNQYVETTVKDTIDQYVESKSTEMQSYVAQAASESFSAAQSAEEASTNTQQSAQYVSEANNYATQSQTNAASAAKSASDALLSEENAAHSAQIAAEMVASIDLSNLAKTDLSNISQGLFFGDLTEDKRVRFSNGLVMQWGGSIIKAGTLDLLITLPIEYTTYFRAFAISNSSTASSESVYATSNNGLTGFYAHRSGSVSSDTTFSWFTIGI